MFGGYFPFRIRSDFAVKGKQFMFVLSVENAPSLLYTSPFNPQPDFVGLLRFSPLPLCDEMAHFVHDKIDFVNVKKLPTSLVWRYTQLRWCDEIV